MSRSVRNFIAALFVIGVFSVTMQNNLNLLTTKAYADEQEEKPHLKSIYLSEGDNIRYSNNVHSYILDVDKDVNDIFIKARPEDQDDIVEINDEVVTKDNNYKKELTLSKGKNKIDIEVIDTKTKNKSKYVVYVFKGGKDAIYLKDISIDENSIGFLENSRFYNIELDEGTQVVELGTIPEDNAYSVTVNGKELDETNTIKIKFSVIGKYTLNIGVKDKDTGRVCNYVLNVYLGIPVSPNVSEAVNSVLKPNQWIIVNGRWRYNDIMGKSLKNTWFYDESYKSYFHFNNRGNMQTGWIEDGGNWYYLNSKGEMQTGWIYYENEWYYLNSKGAMKIGWIYDNNNWYYLRSDGSMATRWIYNNDKWYYLNTSGVMETGWMYYGEKWYYLTDSGDMKTDWLKYDNEWYYMNSDGSMKSGEWFYEHGNWYYFNYVGNMRHGIWLDVDDKYDYYFNEDGTMRTTPLIVKGYIINFRDDGTAILN